MPWSDLRNQINSKNVLRKMGSISPWFKTKIRKIKSTQKLWESPVFNPKLLSQIIKQTALGKKWAAFRLGENGQHFSLFETKSENFKNCGGKWAAFHPVFNPKSLVSNNKKFGGKMGSMFAVV